MQFNRILIRFGGFNTLVYVVHPINEVENTTLVWADGLSLMTSYKNTILLS
jgi:hypothetical protein